MGQVGCATLAVSKVALSKSGLPDYESLIDFSREFILLERSLGVPKDFQDQICGPLYKLDEQMSSSRFIDQSFSLSSLQN